MESHEHVKTDSSAIPPGADIAALQPIAHQGERVLTTELLAKVYGVAEDQIHDNYRKNEERFAEGTHFHKLKSEALRAFKNQPENFGLVAAKTAHLVLWTERGAARHAKMLHTDAAWSIFGKLEESYFETARETVAPTIQIQASPRDAATTFKALLSVGRLIGLDRNQSALAANKATRKFHSLDLLAAMETIHLVAPQQTAILTPTDIGVRLGGKSGMAVNALLSDRGFQTGKRDAKDRAYWEPTELGQPFAVWQDTDKRHSDGTPVRQLKWSASIVAEISDGAAA